MTHKEVILGPITNTHPTAHHITEAQAHTITDKTPHTADPHHPGVFQDCRRSRPHTLHKHPHKT